MQLGAEICGTAGTTDATLTSQSGANATAKVPVDCGNRAQTQRTTATAKLTLRPLGRQRGATLVVRATAGVRSLTLKLPSGLAFSRSQAKAVAVTRAGGKRAAAKVTLRGSTLTVKVSTKGITRLQVVVPAKATKFRASYANGLRRRSAQKKIKPTLSVVDGAGLTQAPTPAVRFTIGR